MTFPSFSRRLLCGRHSLSCLTVTESEAQALWMPHPGLRE